MRLIELINRLVSLENRYDIGEVPVVMVVNKDDQFLVDKVEYREGKDIISGENEAVFLL